MTKARPSSIDLTALSSQLAKAVSHLGGVVDPSLTFVQNPGIIGFVAPAAQFGDMKFSEISKIAADIGAKAGPLAGPANVVIHDGHVTIGFLIGDSTAVR